MANINPRYVEHYHLWRRDVKLYVKRICFTFAFELTMLQMNSVTLPCVKQMDMERKLEALDSFLTKIDFVSVMQSIAQAQVEMKEQLSGVKNNHLMALNTRNCATQTNNSEPLSQLPTSMQQQHSNFININNNQNKYNLKWTHQY